MSSTPAPSASRHADVTRAKVALSLLVVCGASLARAQPVQPLDARGSDGPAALGGFDFGLQVWESTGVVTATEAYLNQVALVFEPSYRIGAKQFAGTWAEGLTLSGRLLWTNELSGNDPTFRGPSFAGAALFADPPSSAAIFPANVPRGTDGLSRESSLSDLWIGAFHGEIAKVPWIAADVQAGLRLTLPTSDNSLNTGLIVAPSAYVGLARAIGPVTIGYGARFTKYVQRWKTPLIEGDGGAVLVNGQEIEPWRPPSTGYRNWDWGATQLVTADVELPANLSLSAMYAVANNWSYPFESCGVEGVSEADVCADGAALGEVRRPGRSTAGWFSAELDWAPRPWLSLGLGLWTAQPVRLPDGSFANPFFRATRENFTTLYLTVGTSAEAIAHEFQSK